MSFEAATSNVNGTRYLDFTVIRILYYTVVIGTVNFKTFFFLHITITKAALVTQIVVET